LLVLAQNWYVSISQCQFSETAAITDIENILNSFQHNIRNTRNWSKSKQAVCPSKSNRFNLPLQQSDKTCSQWEHSTCDTAHLCWHCPSTQSTLTLR